MLLLFRRYGGVTVNSIEQANFNVSATVHNLGFLPGGMSEAATH